MDLNVTANIKCWVTKYSFEDGPRKKPFGPFCCLAKLIFAGDEIFLIPLNVNRDDEKLVLGRDVFVDKELALADYQIRAERKIKLIEKKIRYEMSKPQTDKYMLSGLTNGVNRLKTNKTPFYDFTKGYKQ